MTITVKSELTGPESFTSADQAARNAVRRLLLSRQPVRVTCSPAEEKKMTEALAKQVAAQQWGMST